MVLFWGGRLALYLLFTRVLGGRAEDPRYTDMKKRWGRGVGLKLFLTFQFQGALLWMIAVGGEALADFQLHRFKADPAHRGKTCRAGLWNYSRHPNYFFEWLVWCAYALYAFASPWGWAGLACPLLMFYFLFRVTGIPLTEAQAVKTKGQDYLDYQRTTSVFVPWFWKNREAPRDR
jgi:steroid 5-alpha reductase family enzyme